MGIGEPLMYVGKEKKPKDVKPTNAAKMFHPCPSSVFSGLQQSRCHTLPVTRYEPGPSPPVSSTSAPRLVTQVLNFACDSVVVANRECVCNRLREGGKKIREEHQRLELKTEDDHSQTTELV